MSNRKRKLAGGAELVAVGDSIPQLFQFLSDNRGKLFTPSLANQEHQ